MDSFAIGVLAFSGDTFEDTMQTSFEEISSEWELWSAVLNKKILEQKFLFYSDNTLSVNQIQNNKQ